MIDERRRVVVRGVSPQVDGGRHPVKRVVGESVAVEADAFADGHDHVTAVLQHRPPGGSRWRDVTMTSLGNDRWTASFVTSATGDHQWRIRAWVDHAGTWREHLEAKAAADVDVPMHLAAGAQLLRDMAGDRRSAAAARLRELADELADEDTPVDERVAIGLDERTAAAMTAGDPRRYATDSATQRVQVDQRRAGFSAWYELFPRSLGGPDRHGTLADVHDELPRIAAMGFDVLYLPPVHPIGISHRKGPNNTTVAGPEDVGSPWAIGGEDGGHLAVHSELGTVEDVAELATVARDEHGIELALDIAFQCSPDHPWVDEHPEWFKQRPDGSIQYAENPPKKYQDIYPLDFETDDVEGLWSALRDVFLFWCDQGVRIFRVDNPHTKAFRFWEWCIAEVRAEHPDVVMLSEAFTRPRVMEELAKRGFAQSYSYFTWREHKWELEQYVREMFHTGHIDFMRPNFWPNTPDILPFHLQHGTRATFDSRLVLAALLNANYGVYGPAYEALEGTPVAPGREEYLDSEKYELRHRVLPSVDDPNSVGWLMRRLNRIRREHPALHRNRNLTLHHVDDDMLMAWSKCTDDGGDVVLVVVSLDPHHGRSGTVHLDMGGLRLDDGEAFVVHDLLDDRQYHWQGSANFVARHPGAPAHVFHVRRRDEAARDQLTTW